MVNQTAGVPNKQYPLSLTELVTIVRGRLTEKDTELIQKVQKTNWNTHHLNLSRLKDRAFAAHALAIGIPVFHGFGNFYALTFYPHEEVIRSVNAAKGRPLEQVASITTTKEYLTELFDWKKLPRGFTHRQILTMMNAFFELGPFGFRGSAALSVEKHLTKTIDGNITVQVIAPGYNCPSNTLLTEALQKAGIHYFGATSPNISSHLTGEEEPAHFKINGIKKDFGSKKPGFIMVAHQSEREATKRHPTHDPMSTSIISFDREYPLQDNKPVVTIERHGSLEMSKITAILDKLGIGYTLGSRASQRLLMRKYSLSQRIFGRIQQSN